MSWHGPRQSGGRGRNQQAGRGCGSFDVLRLFAEFLQLGLEDDDLAGDGGVIGLGADGVDLAIHFLSEKIQGAADRLLGLESVIKLLEVTLQAGEFLGNIGAVGEEDDFLEQTFLVEFKLVQAGALEAGDKLIAIDLDAFLRT